MVKYEVDINDENNNRLKQVSEASEAPVKDILQQFVNESIAKGMVDLAVQQYKNGKLTAMKAWKLSGLTFDEFNALAKD